MPGGPCFKDVFHPAPGSFEPGLRLRGRVVTVLRLMFDGDDLRPSTELARGAWQPQNIRM